MDVKITEYIDQLHNKEYVLRYWPEDGKVRLVSYKELTRESTRKRIYTVIRWYDWHNHRDRDDKRFIPVDLITLPQSVKQEFVNQLIESLTFITRE